MSSLMPSLIRCVSDDCNTPAIVSAISIRSGRHLSLDRNELKVIVRSWKAVDDRRKLGADVLSQVFDLKPDLQKLFFGTMDVSDTDVMRAHPSFTKHAMYCIQDTFSMFLHISVKRLIDNECVGLLRLTHQVGRAHATIHKVRFDAEYWMLFKNAVIDQMEPYCKKARVNVKLAREVWNRFLMFLIMEMKHSFHRQTIKRLSCPDLSNLFGAIVNDYQDCESNGEYQKTSSPSRRVSTCLGDTHTNLGVAGRGMSFGGVVAAPEGIMTEPPKRKNLSVSVHGQLISQSDSKRRPLFSLSTLSTATDSSEEENTPPENGSIGRGASVLLGAAPASTQSLAVEVGAKCPAGGGQVSGGSSPARRATPRLAFRNWISRLKGSMTSL